MPVTPYAKLLVSVNGGGVQSGGLTVAVGDTIALSAENTTGWGVPAARWEIYDYPVGFALPAGWIFDNDTGVYYYLGNSPAPSTFTIGPWGKYMLRLTVLGGNTAANPYLTDEDTALTVPSPSGLADTGYLESNQFSDFKKAVAGIQANWRVIESVLASTFINNDWKSSVRAATTANIVLSGPQTVDGVALIAGNFCLVKNQAAPATNGIYQVNAGAWTRRGDADSSAKVTSGMAVYVSEGTTNGNTAWVLTTPDPITLGVTSLTFTSLVNAAMINVALGLDPDRVVMTNAAQELVAVGTSHVTWETAATKDALVAAGRDFGVTATNAITLSAAAASSLTCSAGNLALTASSVTASAALTAGSGGNAVSVTCDANNDHVVATVNGTQVFHATTSTFRVDVASLSFEPAVSNPIIQQQQRVGNNAPFRTRLLGQDAATAASGGGKEVGGTLNIGGGAGLAGFLAGPVKHIGGTLVANICAPFEFHHGTESSSTKYAEIGQSAAGITRFLAQAALKLEATTDVSMVGATATVTSAGTVTCTGGGAISITTTAGNATFGTTDAAGSATIKAGTAGSLNQTVHDASANTVITTIANQEVERGTVASSKFTRKTTFTSKWYEEEAASHQTLASTSPTNIFTDSAVPQSAMTEYVATIMCYGSTRAYGVQRVVHVSRDGASAPVINANQDTEAEQRPVNDNNGIAYAVLWKVSTNDIVLELTAPDSTSTTVGCVVTRRVLIA